MPKARLVRPIVGCGQARFQSTVPIPRPYKFHIGAGFAGKPAHPHHSTGKEPVDFPIGSSIRTWRDNTLQRRKSVQSTSAGEDFFYVQEVSMIISFSADLGPIKAFVWPQDAERLGGVQLQGVSIGLADGVGAWVDSGIDPSLFSQAMCYHAHRYSKNAWAGEPETEPGESYDKPVEGWELTPQECIELSHGGVLRERTVQAGSSTVCILNLNARTGILRAANLGDSGFTILRSYSVVYIQPPQTHFFNCPYQLAKLPSTFRRYTGAYVDSPKLAATYSSQLRGGDIIIAYTDGLADNVYPAEMSSIVSLVMRQSLDEQQQAQDLADRLVEYAQTCMFKKHKVSPFEKAAAREGIFYRGGKVDDVTVVVAIVEECQ